MLIESKAAGESATRTGERKKHIEFVGDIGKI